MIERYEIPGLGVVTVLSDTEYWGIRMPDGKVRGRFTHRDHIRHEFQAHLNAVSERGLRTEFLAGARIVRHRRVFVATEWEDDDHENGLIAELYPVVEHACTDECDPGNCAVAHAHEFGHTDAWGDDR
ncbi:hypothetical protein IU501_34465 [Nocardia otitidiscaviarum]|uniref:hypothetical protein n=1 Tax=Nocardia otitidiscaviarum TaxID=1823 RepID=UPI001893304B|nr:hypothetical protein [Nocardia otitidiscaviarum]MBF6138074.1 hypothetical protein [Nocardia otitidiscaviarum]